MEVSIIADRHTLARVCDCKTHDDVLGVNGHFLIRLDDWYNCSNCGKLYDKYTYNDVSYIYCHHKRVMYFYSEYDEQFKSGTSTHKKCTDLMIIGRCRTMMIEDINKLYNKIRLIEECINYDIIRHLVLYVLKYCL
jgi:hypothetical protein